MDFMDSIYYGSTWTCAEASTDPWGLASCYNCDGWPNWEEIPMCNFVHCDESIDCNDEVIQRNFHDEGDCGDGWCDDGSWGIRLDCAAFHYDCGECYADGAGHPEFWDTSGCIKDCNGKWVPMSWLGDGWCDDGAYLCDWAWDGDNCCLDVPDGQEYFVDLDCHGAYSHGGFPSHGDMDNWEIETPTGGPRYGDAGDCNTCVANCP